MMTNCCVGFYIVLLLTLCIKNLNGQSENASTTTQLATNIKPDTNIYQTNGFNSSNVTSGPILIIDKKNIFISTLSYVSESNETRFWAGFKAPSSDGLLVPDEDNSEGPLKSYYGQNIYLQLPETLTTDKIDYIGIWSRENETDLGHVMLYQNASHIRNNVPEALGYHRKTADNKTIFRIPGCTSCNIDEIYINNTCIPAKNPPELKVWESNETHIDPEKYIEDIAIVLYKYVPPCRTGYTRAELDPLQDTHGLIFNSSLIFYVAKDLHGILNHDSYCFKRNNESNLRFFACLENDAVTSTASVQYLYFPFLVISTICFFGSALVYTFILKDKDVHRKCFVGYSVSMTVTFMALIFLQKLNGACNFMGGLFMCSMICSFVWLTCLCLDLICVVTTFKCPEDKTRFYFYVIISLVIPIIILISSLISDGIPDVPNSFIKSYSGQDTCYFENVNLAAFFIPIGLLIFISVMGLAYTSYSINTYKDPDDPAWVRNKSRFKFMLRSCFLVWLTAFIWLVEAIVNMVIMGSGIQFAIDLIEALQGIFVAIIFVFNKYIRKEIKRVIYEKEIRKEQNMRCQELLKQLEKSDPDSASENDNAARRTHAR